VPFRAITVIVMLLFEPVHDLHAEPLLSIQPVVADDMDRDSLLSALRYSLKYLEKLPRDRVVGERPQRFTAGHVMDTLAAFADLLDHSDCVACLAPKIRARFDILPSSGDSQASDVLFTGYYQPLIAGSLVSTAEYRYPVYGKPADLATAERVTLRPFKTVKKVFGRVEGERFKPYYSRREIDELGVLRGRGDEIAWTKDPIDLFFLHVQGSGILRLPDGRSLHLGYAAGNGRPYRSIGRLLIDNGKISQEEMSMQRLRQYLARHAAQRSEIMAYNEHYVFFRILENDSVGSLGIPLTAGRSIATDGGLFPGGALALIATQSPVLDAGRSLSGWRPVTRFVLNQDTGSAIRGPRRADLYFGSGSEPGAQAGFMNRRGKLYFLSLKSRRSRSKGAE
jgi:membrane-bound lytic murein transglycosylase A